MSSSNCSSQNDFAPLSFTSRNNRFRRSMDRAINDGILIPWRKNEPEKPKTALQLLTVDKGGLTYQPAIGEYEDIAEIEFASMYPTLTVTRNISPETVLCSCCKNGAVPEAGYNICEKRRGLGYRGARFGRIEAHEGVTSWGRETLLRAKEIAEDADFSPRRSNQHARSPPDFMACSVTVV